LIIDEIFSFVLIFIIVHWHWLSDGLCINFLSLFLVSTELLYFCSQ